MFRVYLSVEDRRLTGLDALDERRRLGLGEGIELSTTSSRTASGARQAKAEVGEGFARAYFPRTATYVAATVPLRLLIPGDLVSCHSANPDVFTFSDALSAERVTELFVAAMAAAEEQAEAEGEGE